MDEQNRQYQAESQLQQERIEAEQGMNAPAIQQNMNQVQAALIEQTNPDKILDDVELKLRGYRKKWDGSLEKMSDALMNDKGVGRMLFYISTVVNQNTILSHLEAGEISNLIIRVSDDIIDDLVLNWKEYGIKDKILLDHIVNAVTFSAFMSLKRAWKQNEKNWLNKAVVETISSSPRGMPKREGFFNKLRL